MVRTQVQLTQEQARLAKHLAAERGVSMAEVIREALDEAFRSRIPIRSRDDSVRRALDIVGRFHSGSDDGSIRHDDHLAEVYQP